jgi:pimeloyl-ACP methyl ester carboxylesterase
VLIHGALMNHCLWEPKINAFAEKYQVIVYDLRGHGESGKGCLIFIYKALRRQTNYEN